MTLRLPALLVLVPFAAYSVWVAATHGPLGFLGLAGREPWAMQMLVDLVIAFVFTGGWLLGDARRRGRTAWPFVVGLALFGSISALVYVVTGRSRAGR